MTLPVLSGPRVTLRPPREADIEPLAAILQEPEVSEWWVGYTKDRVRDELVFGEHTVTIEVDGEPVGLMYVIPPTDREYPTTIMHIFLATRMRGRALGAEALAVAIRHQFAAGATRVTLDPNVRNEAAIRSYERIGFRRVGVLRDYQVREGGGLDDALFLDITRSDFPDGPQLPAVENA